MLVLGAGGAARAIVLALGGAGARVTVAARRRDAGRAPRPAWCPAGTATGSTRSTPGVFALVVNATPLGMQGEPAPFDVERLNPGQFVVDTVYHPMETPLLAAARARGIRAANGLGHARAPGRARVRALDRVDARRSRSMRAAAAEDPRA